jgi:hypothetical protein
VWLDNKVFTMVGGAQVMFRALLIALPLIAAVGAVLAGRSLVVRIMAVTAIAVVFLVALGGLIAPHRLAQETVSRSQQTSDWERGATDTRDIVHSSIPLLLSSFAALTILALKPRCGAPAKD